MKLIDLQEKAKSGVQIYWIGTYLQPNTENCGKCKSYALIGYLESKYCESCWKKWLKKPGIN